MTTPRRACSSPRCRSSRATGRATTTGARCEAQLKALPHFITEIDGLDIHFIHVRSKHENALPIIVTHGWPGSIIEQLKIVEPLTDPTAHGGNASDAFHLVIPSMPGYGFSGKPTHHRAGTPKRIAARLGGADAPPRLHEVRGARRRLGRAHRRAHGRAGADGIARHPHQHGRRHSARDRQGGLCRRAGACRPLAPRRSTLSTSSPTSTSTASAMRWRWATGRRRCTGSPIRRSPWPPGSSITTSGSYEMHRARLRRRDRGPDARRHPRQHHALLADQHGCLLGSVVLGVQAAVLPAEGVKIPVAVSAFPDEIAPATRSWAEKAYPKLLFYNKHDKGGHFAAFEQPQSMIQTSVRGFGRCARTLAVGSKEISAGQAGRLARGKENARRSSPSIRCNRAFYDPLRQAPHPSRPSSPDTGSGVKA